MSVNGVTTYMNIKISEKWADSNDPFGPGGLKGREGITDLKARDYIGVGCAIIFC
jgi:hypothetical protein